MKLGKKPTHCVLSIGGIDIKKDLGYVDKMSKRIEELVRYYPKIVKGIMEVCP